MANPYINVDEIVKRIDDPKLRDYHSNLFHLALLLNEQGIEQKIKPLYVKFDRDLIQINQCSDCNSPISPVVGIVTTIMYGEPLCGKCINSKLSDLKLATLKEKKRRLDRFIEIFNIYN